MRHPMFGVAAPHGAVARSMFGVVGRIDSARAADVRDAVTRPLGRLAGVRDRTTPSSDRVARCSGSGRVGARSDDILANS